MALHGVDVADKYVLFKVTPVFAEADGVARLEWCAYPRARRGHRGRERLPEAICYAAADINTCFCCGAEVRTLRLRR